jgi:hypothetical protein
MSVASALGVSPSLDVIAPATRFHHFSPNNKKALVKVHQGFLLLVEAAGIEPASASSPPLVLHAYPVLGFNWLLPNRQGSQTAIP